MQKWTLTKLKTHINLLKVDNNFSIVMFIKVQAFSPEILQFCTVYKIRRLLYNIKI